jgi:hypothetical protein
MKTVSCIPFFLSFLFAASLFSQSNINQSLSMNSSGFAPAASAQLDVSATDKGMLVPRMTSAQRTAIAAPATGLLVYDTDTSAFWFYNGVAWVKISPQTVLADTDNDTKIQVEESPDEDIIRFDLGGTEKMALRKNFNEVVRLELKNDNPNLVIGDLAGANLDGAAEENVFLGTQAGAASLEVYDNTFLGNRAGMANTTGSYNAATGKSALTNNTSGSANTANGVSALSSNTVGNRNTAIGNRALFANTSGFSNVAIGAFALHNNTERGNLVAVGDSALYNNGLGTGFYQNGRNNTAIGSKTLFSNTIGSNNTATGNKALFDNTTGGGNTAIGTTALTNNVSGSYNTALGLSALVFNTTGESNTATGNQALQNNLEGFRNTANGNFAMTGNVNGSYNTAFGYLSNVAAEDLTNAASIGSNAVVNASNKVRIGNTTTGVIEGQVAYTFPSDARFKFNIHDDQVPGLAFIEQLRPVTYQFDTRKFDEHLMRNMPDSVQQRHMEGRDYSKSTAAVQTGFLAQEVEQVCKNLGYQFSGLHVPESEVDNYGLAYGSFVPLLVKGMQEQQAIIQSQTEKIEAQQAEIGRLKKLETQLEKITAALAGMGVELR